MLFLNVLIFADFNLFATFYGLVCVFSMFFSILFIHLLYRRTHSSLYSGLKVKTNIRNNNKITRKNKQRNVTNTLEYRH